MWISYDELNKAERVLLRARGHQGLDSSWQVYRNDTDGLLSMRHRPRQIPHEVERFSDHERAWLVAALRVMQGCPFLWDSIRPQTIERPTDSQLESLLERVER